jgi:hypothetical protein
MDDLFFGFSGTGQDTCLAHPLIFAPLLAFDAKPALLPFA